jgi:hypothetical protein
MWKMFKVSLENVPETFYPQTSIKRLALEMRTEMRRDLL